MRNQRKRTQRVADENDGQAPVEPDAAQDAPATPADTVPISAYKTLQRELQKVKDEVKQYKGEPSLEEQLAAATEEKTRLQRLLEAADARAKAPEIAPLVDKFVEKHGIVPDAELLEEMKKLTQSAPASTRPETSGMRNAPAQTPQQKEEQQVLDLLKKEQLW